MNTETVNERLKRTLERNRPAISAPKKASPFTQLAPQKVSAPVERELPLDVPLRKAEKKAPAPINYLKKEKARAKKTFNAIKEETKLSRRMVYIGWGFSFFLLLRLIFAGGGIVDNVKKFSILQDKKNELSLIEEDNIKISKEIDRIEKNASFQKKIVRDNLGFIASDEYLVIFNDVKSEKSI